MAVLAHKLVAMLSLGFALTAIGGEARLAYPTDEPVIASIEWAPTNRIVRAAPDGDNWPFMGKAAHGFS